VQRIQFNRGRTLLAIAFFASGVAFFVFAFLNPEEFANARRGRWMASEFGRTIPLPILTVACAALAVRAINLALFNPVAVEFTSTSLRLNSFWGMKEVPWSQVSRAGAQWYMKHPQLCVETRAGKTIKVPLGGTDFDPDRTGELLQAIFIRAGLASPSAPTGTRGNPDAAIERYLAQRATEAVAASDAAAVAEAASSQRPSFGRKRA
jgi:hypothetical protein